MKNLNLKIFVACHQPCKIHEDDVFIPIQVWKKNAKVDLWILWDDTWDSISNLNDKYCELTWQYRVRKNYNLENVDYIWFFHYRRFFWYKYKTNIFNLIKNLGISWNFYHAYMEHVRFLSREEIDFQALWQQIKNYIYIHKNNIYLPKRHHTPKSKALKDLCTSNKKIRELILNSIKEAEPLYYSTTIDTIKTYNKHNHRNMFIMDKNYFNRYMEFQFNILFKLDALLKQYNLEKVDNDWKRMMGMYSESFINFFTNFEEKYNNCKISRQANILFLKD